MKSLTYLVLLCSLMVQAQTKTEPSEPKVEHLTTTEVLAINQVAAEINKASQDAGNVVADIQKAHPGYTFDFRTGQLVKLVPIQKPEAQEKTEKRTVTAPETPLPKTNP